MPLAVMVVTVVVLAPIGLLATIGLLWWIGWRRGIAGLRRGPRYK
jgi:hypothetical protein